MYEVYLERTAEGDLKRLPVDDFHRLVERIRALSHDPRPVGARKVAGGKRDWRIRVGRFRVVYEVDDAAKVVRVMRVRSRQRAYG